MEQHNRYREEELEKEQEQEQKEKETKAENKEEKQKKSKKIENKHSDEEYEALEEKYSLLLSEVESLKDSLLRNRAEVENFKKRINEERINERKYCLKDFLQELIQIIDIFEQAINSKTEDENVKKFLNGFVMINTMFKQVLLAEGVVKIEALNKPFDPTFHNAIEMVEVENVESGIVVEEMLAGYMYKDRVLRPSMVKVSN